MVIISWHVIAILNVNTQKIYLDNQQQEEENDELVVNSLVNAQLQRQENLVQRNRLDVTLRSVHHPISSFLATVENG